ncbi:MAG: hypothetical protein J0L77_00935 [Alphaproteobacteria bacterium]|nr:hypothetical protein [Alphaproteobacteria bacterium]
MTPRTLFLIELLDKLGTPLMQSASAVGGDDMTQAKALAAMVGSSVQLGMSLGQVVGVNDTAGNEDEADGIRVALTTLSGPMIAELYRVSGKIPGDDDVRRLSKSLESIVTLAQNFSPSAGHTARLKLMDGSRPLYDASQSQIFYLSALLPVLSAVAEFSYGIPETQLLSDIAQKLDIRAENLRGDLMGAGADEAEIKFSELMILHSLARLYAECHRAQTLKIMASDQAEKTPDIVDVWSAFDIRLSMLETLLNIAVPAGQRSASASLTPVSPPPAPEHTPAAPITPPPQQPVSSVSTGNGVASNPGGNPMAFFKKKPADGENAS